MQFDPDSHLIAEGDRILRERQKKDSEPIPTFLFWLLIWITLLIVVIGFLQIHGEYHAVAAWPRHHPVSFFAVIVMILLRKRLFRLVIKILGFGKK